MKFYDVIIVGGGPAGLTCGQYCARAGRKTAIIDNCDSQLLSISRVENYPGCEEMSGADLLNRFEDQAIKFGCEIIFGEVTEIERTDEHLFKLKDDYYTIRVDGEEEEYGAKAIVLAMGCEHKHLNIPGEPELTGKGVSYCAVCDGPFFQDKKIYVIGGGDSACQEAVYLTKYSNDVTIIHRRNEFRAQKDVVDKMLAAGVKTMMNTKVQAINGKDSVTSIVISESSNEDEWMDIPADAVFIFAGMNPKNNIKYKGRCEEPCWNAGNYKKETSEEGIFVIGDVKGHPFKQIITAAADGAIAAHYADAYITSLSM